MIAQTPKLKKSKQPYDYIGQTVYVFHDKMDGRVVLSFSPEWTDCFIGERDNIKPQRKTGGSIQAKPKKLTPAEKENKDDLNAFYREIGQHVTFNCQNCDKPLYAYTPWAKRCSSAHILPKSGFDSIKANPHNILFMGSDLMCACGCHDIWDASLEKRKSMRIYPYAIEQFATHLRYELNDEDLISACDYLGINWKEYEN